MSKIPLSFSCYSLYAWNSDQLEKNIGLVDLTKKIEACNLATNRYQYILNEIDYFVHEDITDTDEFTEEFTLDR